MRGRISATFAAILNNQAATRIASGLNSRPPGPGGLSVRGLDANPIIHRRLDSLLAAEMSLGCLYRDVAGEELDLFELEQIQFGCGYFASTASRQKPVEPVALSHLTFGGAGRVAVMRTRVF